MNEFDLIKTFFNASQLNFPSEFIEHSIGDDCAVLNVPATHELCLSVDTLIEDVHFPAGAKAYDIGTRSLCVTLSDLAAMGAKPIGFTLAISLPIALKENTDWLAGFCDGLASIAQRYDCPLIGGDTTKSPVLTISVQVHGICEKGKSLKRSGAQVGDQVCVTATQDRGLGDGAGALSHVLSDPVSGNPLTKAFWKPLPQIEIGQSLIGVATSCIDVSDGLIQDLNHICQRSQVAMRLDPMALPLSGNLLSNYSQEEALGFALNGGDDYQLAFTLPAGVSLANNVVCIGEVIISDHHSVQIPMLPSIKSTGFNHF